jgi:hypothetical protein
MASWNVRSLNQAQSIRNLIGELYKCGIVIPATREIKRGGTDLFDSEDYTVCYDGVLEQGTF